MPPAPQRSALTLFLLRYPLFILFALGITGFAAWWWTREPGPPSLPLFTEPTEAHRPALKAALAPSLKKFYATPDDTHRLDAIGAVRDYRRSFPDATLYDLIDPAAVPRWNVPVERERAEAQHQKEMAALQAAIAEQFKHLPKDSPEQHAAITEAYALDRRFSFRAIEQMLERYQEGTQKEAELVKLQADFFRVIDELAVPKNYRRAENEHHLLIRQYFEKYVELSRRSLKFIPTTCEGEQLPNYQDRVYYQDRVSLNPAVCNAAITEYEAFEREQQHKFRDYWQSRPKPWGNPTDRQHEPFLRSRMLAKAAAIKKLLADREAHQEFIRRKLNDLLR